MPFKSQAQRRFFHWAASKGKEGITRGTVKEWEDETPKGKKLPEKVKKKSAEIRNEQYPSTDEVDDGVNMRDYHADPITKKAVVAALFDELQSIRGV